MSGYTKLVARANARNLKVNEPIGKNIDIPDARQLIQRYVPDDVLHYMGSGSTAFAFRSETTGRVWKVTHETVAGSYAQLSRHMWSRNDLFPRVHNVFLTEMPGSARRQSWRTAAYVICMDHYAAMEGPDELDVRGASDVTDTLCGWVCPDERVIEDKLASVWKRATFDKQYTQREQKLDWAFRTAQMARYVQNHCANIDIRWDLHYNNIMSDQATKKLVIVDPLYTTTLR